MTVTWKLFWSATGTAVTVALGVGLIAVAWPVAVVAVAVAVAAFSAAAAWVIAGSVVFAILRPSVLRWFARAVTAAVVVHGAWIIAFSVLADRRPLLLAALAVLGLAEYGTACAVEYVLTSLQRRPPAHDHGRVLEQPEQVLASALDRAGYGWLRIRSWEPIGGRDDG